MAHYFPFVQFEFTHSIGPPAGRYTVGEGMALGSADVVGIKLRGATARRPGILRRGAQDVADGQEPEDLSVIVATVVLGTAMLPDAGPGRELLAGAKASVEEQDRWIDRALGVLNRVVWAHRLCAADPYALDLTRADARATRIGYGPAESVVLGHWDAAIAVPARRPPRVKPEERLMPMDAMTALLAGRAVALESEELILRAVLDLDHGRTRAAAVGIHAAQEFLLGETEGAELAVAARERLDKVIDSRERVSELTRQARSGPLSEADVDRLRAVVEAIGAFVDVWRYQPLGYREPKVTT